MTETVIPATYVEVRAEGLASAGGVGAGVVGVVGTAAGIVGSMRDVVFRVTSDVRPFYEIGRRYPKVTLFGVAFEEA